jgi:translocation and assembly module TamB
MSLKGVISKCIKGLLSLFTLSISLLLVFLYVAVFTHAGNKLIITEIQKFEPRLNVVLSEGILINTPVFEQIEWSDKEINLTFKNVQYQLGWRCFFNALCFDTLTADSAQIEIGSTADNEDIKNNTPFSLDLPIGIYFKDLDIKNINVKVASVEVDAKRLEFNGTGLHRDITLDAIVTDLTVILPDDISSPEKKIIHADNIYSGFASILNHLDLPEVSLPFKLIANKATIEGFDLIQNKQKLLRINHVSSHFSFEETNINIEKLQLDMPEIDAQLNGNIRLTGNYPTTLNGVGHLKNIPGLQPESLLSGQTIKLESHGELNDLHSTILLSDLISATISHQIDLLSDNLPFQIELQWDKLNWPLAGEPTIQTSKTKISGKGDLNNYQLQLKGYYEAGLLPIAEVDLIGKGNLHSLTISQLLINTLDGHAKLNGNLSWQDEISWLGNLDIEHLSFSELNPAYSGYVSGRIKQSVAIQLTENNKPHWSFDFPQIALQGTFLERPLSINGLASGDAKQGINVRNLAVFNGDNKLTINGKIAAKNDLAINVDIRDLSKIIIDSEGQLKGIIDLTGSIEEINVNSQLTASQIKYLTASAEKITLSGKSVLNDLPTADFLLKANNIIINNQRIDSFAMTVTPTAIKKEKVNHAIQLALESPIAIVDLGLLVSQEKDITSALVNKGMVKSQQGLWQLNQPFNISIEQNKIDLSSHCWYSTIPQSTSVNSELCISHFNVGEDGLINMDINHFEAATLAPFIPESLVLEGKLDATLKLQWLKNQRPTIEALLNGKGMAFNIKDDDIQQEFIRYPVEQLHFKLTSDAQRSDFNLQATSKGLIHTSLSGYLYLDEVTNKPEIDAKLDFSLPDLDAFSILIPQVDKLTGQLQANLSINGRLDKPDVNGKILVTNTVVTSLHSPIQITNLNAQIDVNKNKADIDGYFFTTSPVSTKEKSKTLADGIIFIKDTAVSALNIPQRIAELRNKTEKEDETDGRVAFTGLFDWSNTPKGNINFKAKKMHINDYGKVELYLSPDLNLSYDQHLNLEGVINVDKGSIVVKELPEGAVSVSKDIVVVDRKAKKTSADLPVKMDMKISLGKQLHVKAIGLDSYVHGDLLVAKTLSKALTVHGELTFSEGTYRAFAQQLVIQNSRVIFQGQATAPYLSLEAIRDPNSIEDSVTAGVRVTGLPDQLQLTLFSDSTMSQQNIISYITRGQSISEDTSVSNNQIAAALISFGTGQTDELMNQLGGKVGIEDLAIATTGDGDEQAVGIKGTIAPGIELSYGVGVFDSFNAFSIRYKLFERFYIEASTGLSHAVDAYYQWDWD